MSKLCTIVDCTSPLLAKGMCIAHYNRVRKYGTPDDPPIVARMKLQREAVSRLTTPEALQDGECWEWPGGRLPSGYGVMAPCLTVLPSKVAHRNAYAIAHGLTEIPAELFACHRCDNRICFRPSHIFLGTHADNMRDMATKGRVVARPSRGSQSYWGKLTREDVLDVIRLRNEGLLQREIAAIVGVNKGIISDLLRGKTRYLDEVAS